MWEEGFVRSTTGWNGWVVAGEWAREWSQVGMYICMYSWCCGRPGERGFDRRTGMHKGKICSAGCRFGEPVGERERIRGWDCFCVFCLRVCLPAHRLSVMHEPLAGRGKCRLRARSRSGLPSLCCCSGSRLSIGPGVGRRGGEEAETPRARQDRIYDDAQTKRSIAIYRANMTPSLQLNSRERNSDGLGLDKKKALDDRVGGYACNVVPEMFRVGWPGFLPGRLETKEADAGLPSAAHQTPTLRAPRHPQEPRRGLYKVTVVCGTAMHAARGLENATYIRTGKAPETIGPVCPCGRGFPPSNAHSMRLNPYPGVTNHTGDARDWV
ncbi:uncharacterized protein B0H64DRAFT_73741 [Chaetomium fimeti]|uniref:Uncharacterized protein n=1 Tax=Chaetomium fimeti TaxID=1854472 RepID=A0AAE0HLD5_9PEZI|nr:hypothetical protein B0H64DRAFT_73741 [Chaetomium fimeti]